MLQGSIEISGKRLEVDWHGPGPDEAASLVFLHDGLGCVATWGDFPARLAEATGCGALVMSRAGHGRSDPCALPRPVSFMHQEGLEVLPALLAAAEVRRCVLIGHSDGGSIALIYAGGTTAGTLAAVITVAAHAFCEEITVRAIERARTEFGRGDLRARLARYHLDNTDCAFRGWCDTWLHPDFRSWNIGEYLPRIRVPVLALQGERDEYGSLEQVEAIVEGTGAERVVLPACGHSPHRERSDETLAVMRTFVTRILGETR